MLKMNQARRCYNRKVKKVEYDIGDLVLACHPALKRGLSKGLAPKYYGPFKIIGKYANQCDYLIKREGHPKSKVKQIHVNNLKSYFERGQPIDQARTKQGQDSEGSTDLENKVFPNSRRKKVLKKTAPKRGGRPVPLN